MSCKCKDCVSACRRNPGWPTPDEVRVLMDKGYGDRLMLDWWNSESSLEAEDGTESIYILSPAVDGSEGEYAPMNPMSIFAVLSWYKGRCVFLTKDNLCEVHAIKPQECRVIYGCVEHDGGEHRKVAETWNNAKARALVEEWKTKYLGEQFFGE